MHATLSNEMVVRTDGRFQLRFYSHAHALASLRYISGTKLDERIIRADLDPGYQENRQYGRGKSGGQIRDEYRGQYLSRLF